MTPGIHEISPTAYHADPCEQPSLSSSIAHILCTSSPAHARTAHPRLNPEHIRKDADHFDLGTAAHALILEGRDAITVVEADDWRTKAAKQARDAARAAGQIPMLPAQHEQTKAMVAATWEQLAQVDVDPPLLRNGKPEQTLVWDEPGVNCRALVDWLHDDSTAIDDFKTTSASANPEKWSRSLFAFGGDVQAAFYLRGLETLTGEQAEFRFIVQETYPPFALSVISLGPDVMTLARKKVAYALDVWRRCTRDDEWPTYPSEVCYAELPAWEEQRWLELEAREAA